MSTQYCTGFAPELIRKSQTMKPLVELELGLALLVDVTKDEIRVWPQSKLSAILWLWNIIFVLVLCMAIVYAIQQDAQFGPQRQMAVALAGAAIVTQIVSLVALIVVRKRIRSVTPIFRVTRQGIYTGHEPKYFKPWSEIDAISGMVDQKPAKIDAVLLFEFNDAGVGVRLPTTAGKAKKVIDTCKEFRRKVANVDIDQALHSQSAIACPYCFKESDSLKNIQFGTIVLVPLIYHSVKLTRTTCCINCARRKLMSDSLRNLLTCHIFWPVVWFGAVIIPQTGKLFARGHDKEALRDVL